MYQTKPVIATVTGYAVAGGFELTLWRDLRVVEELPVAIRPRRTASTRGLPR
jgi:enoyl-CoA hydratase